jgi:nitroreductase
LIHRKEKEVRRTRVNIGAEGLAPGVYRYLPESHRLRPAIAGTVTADLVRAAPEAGAASQNLALQAAAQGLGTVVIGAFDDDAVARALHLAAGERPLALMSIGRPG